MCTCGFRLFNFKTSALKLSRRRPDTLDGVRVFQTRGDLAQVFQLSSHLLKCSGEQNCDLEA